jgi:hypothetical protein
VVDHSFVALAGQNARKTIAENSEDVAAWLEKRPGAWGALAGRMILRCREGIGRSLNDAERRVAWELLWRELMMLREER